MLTLIDLTTIKNKRWLKIYGEDFSVSLPKSVSAETIKDDED